MASPPPEAPEPVGTVVRLAESAPGADPRKPYHPQLRQRSWGQQRWHVDRTTFWPVPVRDFDDVPRLLREHVLPGHVPPEPPLRLEDTVVTVGSCFAEELRRMLDLAGFGTGAFWVPAGLNNTFAIVDFLSWVVVGESTPTAYRYERDEDGELREWTPQEERERYRDHVQQAGAFVFTLGLAEVWSERDTGRVFWRGVPEHIFAADRHEFRVSSVDENSANISRIVGLIRAVNPAAPIVFTVSPIPLQATFGNASVITADCVSKSTLRMAVHQALAAKPAGVSYWPAFEAVKWCGPVFDWRAVSPDSRHPRPYLVYCILDAFVEAYFGVAAAATLRRRLRTLEPNTLKRPWRRVDWSRVRRVPGGLVRRGRRIAARGAR